MADEDTYFAKDQSPALLDIYELSAFVDLRNEQLILRAKTFRVLAGHGQIAL